MEKIRFYKMSGSGNDFIIIDNRQEVIDKSILKDLIVGVCRRKMSAGADGLILLEDSASADFKWHFYNSDGSRAEMCGNGARCVSRFAFLNGITDRKLSFETDVGLVLAEIVDNRVKIKMTDPTDLREDRSLDLGEKTLQYHFINTGVPHVVIRTDNIEDTDVEHVGRSIRYHENFSPAGTNANFVGLEDPNTVSVRTYERGVEGETLACGTGAVAAALIMAHKDGLTSPVEVRTRSGEFLRVYFKQDSIVFTDIYLEGDARVIYKGELWEEAWN
jgi:diaminopimelate epimerase